MERSVRLLNDAYFAGQLSFEDYRTKAAALLRPLSMNQRVRYANMLFVTV